jgi:hypothetical protein
MRKSPWAVSLVMLGLFALFPPSCSSDPVVVDAGPPPCDQECQDKTAVRAVREMMKLIYNLTLQGKPIGPQSAAVACPKGGKAFVYGSATSNADQGTTEVKLTYEAEACAYEQRDNDVEESYDVVLTGKIVQDGVLAVQPSSSTALVMKGESVTLSGTVRLPAVAYRAEACTLDMTQSGNKLTATLCGRTVGIDL